MTCLPTKKKCRVDYFTSKWRQYIKLQHLKCKNIRKGINYFEIPYNFEEIYPRHKRRLSISSEWKVNNASVKVFVSFIANNF